MNAVGIDVSKGKSMAAVMRPCGEAALAPFEVSRTGSEPSEPAKKLKSLSGETRAVMEYAGYYRAPVALALCEAGPYVSIVNPPLAHDYGNNSLRRVKTDRKDAIKPANYALDRRTQPPKYQPPEDARLLLKTTCRQYRQASKILAMQKNNLITLPDMTFPGANRFFSGPMRDDGNEKRVDFVEIFRHGQCVAGRSEKAFQERFKNWRKKRGYRYNEKKAAEIYAAARSCVCPMPKTDESRLLVERAVSQVRASSKAPAAPDGQMRKLAETLPEYPVVMEMRGVGPRLMAEIGDVRRFHSKGAPAAYAGVDAPPYQSGTVDVRSRSITRRGSPSLRRTLFLVMSVLLQKSPQDQPVYQFMDKKRAQGKPYKIYMMAAANKFLWTLWRKDNFSFFSALS